MRSILCVFSLEVPMKLSWFSFYNIVLALWVGGMALFTFIVTPVIFKSYPRDQAGEIVGRLFPGLFSIQPCTRRTGPRPVLYRCE